MLDLLSCCSLFPVVLPQHDYTVFVGSFNLSRPSTKHLYVHLRNEQRNDAWHPLFICLSFAFHASSSPFFSHPYLPCCTHLSPHLLFTLENLQTFSRSLSRHVPAARFVSSPLRRARRSPSSQRPPSRTNSTNPSLHFIFTSGKFWEHQKWGFASEESGNELTF